MQLEGKIYDTQGNEIALKPGHILVMGKDAFCQIPAPETIEAKMTYIEPTEEQLRRYQRLNVPTIPLVEGETPGDE
jgi:hypothetical protein